MPASPPGPARSGSARPASPSGCDETGAPGRALADRAEPVHGHPGVRTGRDPQGYGGPGPWWLPLLGGLLAAAAGGALLAAEASGHSGPRRLLAATIAFAVLAVLTGGLHLDGLADTADGLGSRRPRDEALDIMRRSDIGPMGVAALLLVILLQVTALASLTPEVPSAVALVAAVITSRVAVILAAGSAAARPGGFGALIAGSTTARARAGRSWRCSWWSLRAGRRPAVPPWPCAAWRLSWRACSRPHFCVAARGGSAA